MNFKDLIPLSVAAALLGRRRGGRKTHAATLHRWARRGLRGVRLETVRVGGVVCTTVASLQNFFAALSQFESAELSENHTSHFSEPPSPEGRDAQIESALRSRRLLPEGEPRRSSDDGSDNRDGAGR